MQIQQKPERSLVGLQKKELMRCVKIHGDGSSIIQMGMKDDEVIDSNEKPCIKERFFYLFLFFKVMIRSWLK